MPATTHANRQWIYSKRPTGRVSEEHYNLVENDLSPELAANEVIVRARFISVDPYMRINQSERNTFDEPHPLGKVQGGGAVCQVIASNSPNFNVDDWVLTYTGWQLFAKCHSGDLTKLDPKLAPVSTALGVLGMPGRTAWFGLMDAGMPKPGETVLVSGAAGAVGSLVVQFAKKAGCKVYGIAGGAEKGKFITDKLGADDAIDYKKFPDSNSMSAEIAARTGGVDVYFDNVGGYITDAVIPNIKLRARIIICGAMSQYDGGLDKPDVGPRFLQYMLFNRATIQGILARDFNHRMSEMLNIVGPWVRNKEIVFEETFVDGFEKLPAALNSLFEGKSVGKLLVRV